MTHRVERRIAVHPAPWPAPGRPTPSPPAPPGRTFRTVTGRRTGRDWRTPAPVRVALEDARKIAPSGIARSSQRAPCRRRRTRTRTPCRCLEAPARAPAAPHLLFRRQPSDESDADLRDWAARAWRERAGVDAVLHQARRLAGAARRAAPRGLRWAPAGRAECDRRAVSRPAPGVRWRQQRASHRARKPAAPSRRSQRRVLMEVGVPRSDDRNVHAMPEQRAELADVARTGDVQDVGLEGRQRGVHRPVVPPEQRIERQVVFESERRGASATAPAAGRIRVARRTVAGPPCTQRNGCRGVARRSRARGSVARSRLPPQYESVNSATLGTCPIVTR